MRNRAIVTLSKAAQAEARGLVIETDAAVMALNKPSGLACHTRNPGDPSLDRLLWAFARSNGKRPHLVHRLDRDTSGIILAAQTKPAAAFLHAAFEARKVRKTYLALVATPIEPNDRGTIHAPLADRRAGALVYSAPVDPTAPGARKAQTRWQRLAMGDGVALLAVQPLTGRTHQIRAHLAHVGMAILGDGQYGLSGLPPGAPSLPYPAKRTLLHALRLEFPHPDGNTAIRSAPPPEDFVVAARGYGLEDGLTAGLAAPLEAD
ncbi:MAG: RluA family pseudouridine synthase [Pseudomonadota bacterium]